MRTLLELIESRSDLDISKPWTMNASQWLIANNIHEPFIAEISPMQYAHLGKQQKAAYDAKRNKEWQASIDGKAEWARLVSQAFKDGKFDKDDSDVSKDALDAMRRQNMYDSKAEKENQLNKELDLNRINDASELKAGDVVYHVLYRDYVTISKVGKKSVSAEYRGETINIKPKMLNWLSYNDVVSKIG